MKSKEYSANEVAKRGLIGVKSTITVINMVLKGKIGRVVKCENRNRYYISQTEIDNWNK